MPILFRNLCPFGKIRLWDGGQANPKKESDGIVTQGYAVFSVTQDVPPSQ